jgi:3'(2'), 5'-bisphosphate nucleotidase
MKYDIDILKIVQIAKDAGDKISQIYNDDNFKTYSKEDNSPLTTADLEANSIICKQLKILYPNIPIISEENINATYEKRKSWELFWMIDPLDGTREFIDRSGEFTVNIALIENNKPVMGVVYAPIFDLMFYGKTGCGAFCNHKKIVNNQNSDTLRFAISRNNISDKTIEYIKLYKTNKTKQQTKMGSSLKLCLVGLGEFDISPRFAPTMEWDTAASQAILIEVNKNIYMADEKTPLKYNKQELRNPYFIAK